MLWKRPLGAGGSGDGGWTAEVALKVVRGSVSTLFLCHGAQTSPIIPRPAITKDSSPMAHSQVLGHDQMYCTCRNLNVVVDSSNQLAEKFG
jgi:hypothetical protein